MRDPASISNAVSEDEKITMPEAIACIRWLQSEVGRAVDMHNRLMADVALALAKDMSERQKDSK